MIRKPDSENPDQPEDSKEIKLMEVFVASWDGRCDACRKPIKLDERYWSWMLGPKQALFMHLPCLAMWTGAIRKDVETAIEAMGCG